MTAQAAEKIEAPVAERGEVVAFSPPRLPYHPAIQERFGIDKSGWKALVEAVFPSAKSVDSVAMVLSYCKARNLDPFKKPVHIVPMWDSKSGGYIETIWPGIAELRTTAFRTGQYAGCDEAVFGPMIEQQFTGKVKNKGNWEDKTVQVQFPEWCRITVYRDLNGRVCKFVGPKVGWLESYATIGSSDLPNEMWQSRPEGQLEKCAEAAALRKAFPEELGNQLSAEEMEGRRIYDPAHTARDVTPKPPAPPVPPSPPTPAADEAAEATLVPRDEAQEAPPPQKKSTRRERQHAAAAENAIPDAGTDPEAFLTWIETKLAAITDPDALETIWNDEIAPRMDGLFPPDQETAMAKYRQHEARLQA